MNNRTALMALPRLKDKAQYFKEPRPVEFIVRSLIIFIYIIVHKEDSILKITYSRAPDWMILGYLQGTIVPQGGR